MFTLTFIIEASTGRPDERGLSAYKIRRHIEGSLRRLKTGYVELYQMHHIERHATWDEIWGAFEALVNQGKACYIGASNFGARHLPRPRRLRS